MLFKLLLPGPIPARLPHRTTMAVSAVIMVGGGIGHHLARPCRPSRRYCRASLGLPGAGHITSGRFIVAARVAQVQLSVIPYPSVLPGAMAVQVIMHHAHWKTVCFPPCLTFARLRDRSVCMAPESINPPPAPLYPENHSVPSSLHSPPVAIQQFDGFGVYLLITYVSPPSECAFRS